MIHQFLLPAACLALLFEEDLLGFRLKVGFQLNLGLDLIKWVMLVMFGFIGFWFRIWDPGESSLILSFEALWNWNLVLLFFGNEGRRFLSI